MITRSIGTACLTISLAAAVGCGPTTRKSPGTGTGVDAPTSSGDGNNNGNGDGNNNGTGCQKIDVLFVIDNSGSMAQEQTNLIANFPQFIAVLDASGLDYRVGVTTTGRDYTYNMTIPNVGTLPQSQTGGDNGTLLHPSACAMSHPWIDKTDPTPATTFECVANVGTNGPSDEMPLGAMRDAFEERVADGTNAGFHRADALLGVVILTDENDCSYEHPVTLGFTETLCTTMQEPVANYVGFLDTFTGNRTRWATAVIAGKGPGSCSSTFGGAEEATRLEDFVTQTGANAVMSSICDGDLSIGLGQALSLFQSACGGIIF